jgi:hypothetical protein
MSSRHRAPKYCGVHSLCVYFLFRFIEFLSFQHVLKSIVKSISSGSDTEIDTLLLNDFIMIVLCSIWMLDALYWSIILTFVSLASYDLSVCLSLVSVLLTITWLSCHCQLLGNCNGHCFTSVRNSFQLQVQSVFVSSLTVFIYHRFQYSSACLPVVASVYCHFGSPFFLDTWPRRFDLLLHIHYPLVILVHRTEYSNLVTR